MRKLITPKQKLNLLFDLDLTYYQKLGYKLLLLDLDNTICPYYAKHIDEKSAAFIKEAEKLGFKVIIFSNNKPERVEGFVEGYDIKTISYALKPLKRSYKRVLKEYGFKPSEVIAVGDQMLTDVIGANRCGIFSIYVNPIIDKDSITTVLSRKIERFLFKYVVKE